MHTVLIREHLMRSPSISPAGPRHVLPWTSSDIARTWMDLASLTS